MNDFGIPAYVNGRTGDKDLSRVVNRALLLNLLRRNGSVSRASLAKESGLTKVTVSSQVADLIKLGVVKETGIGASELGRKPVMLEVDGEAGMALGISISTGSLHVVTMNLAGKTERDESLPIEDHTPEGVSAAIMAVVQKAKRRAKQSRFGLYGIGIAVPGAVERGTGRVVRSAKLNWTNVPFRENLARLYRGILHVGNDAALATIAERQLHDPEVDDFVCLLIDEGIGSGAYINGAIHYGHNGQYGEVGHMTIVHGGPQCPCGNRGCWDLYGSELALRQALGAARKGPAPDEEELLALAAAPPAWSRKAFDDFIGYLTSGVVSVINSTAPSTMAINSGVLAASPGMFEALKAGVADRAMAHMSRCDIRLSSLGKAAAAIGAAMAATDSFYERLVLQDGA
jgi:predicted NBD/HSP70 family sugar kinase